jgi:hypothetical protein
MSAANTVRDSSTADLSSRSSKLKRGAISEASLALHSQSKHSASSIQAESSLREDVKAILLSNDEPAPRRMARAVQGREGLDAIHVIANGRPAEVSFRAGAMGAMDEYAGELAEVGRMMRDGEFDARATVNRQTDIGAIPSTIIQRVRCRSHNVKSWRKS